MRKLMISLLGILLVGIGLERLYAYQHGGFSLNKVLSKLENTESEWLPSDIDSLLHQSFRYIGSGGTCFAFLGQDGKTVLKLFKHQHLSPRSLFYKFPFPLPLERMRLAQILKKENEQQHKRLPFLFNSCALAHRHLQQETGILYLCLKKNPLNPHVLTLIDRWGFSHQLPLSQTEFALQKKAIPLFSHLQQLLNVGKINECKTALNALLSQIAQRARKGIADRDPNLCINFGYCEARAIEFDIGSFFSASPFTPFSLARELFFCTHTLQKWLEKESPELLHYLHEQIYKIAA